MAQLHTALAFQEQQAPVIVVIEHLPAEHFVELKQVTALEAGQPDNGRILHQNKYKGGTAYHQ